MDNKERKSLLRFGMVLLLISILISVNVVADEEDKKVLFISSYSASFPSVPEQIQGIQSVFNENGILFDIEFMDTKRLYTKENIENFYQSLTYKLDTLESYDLVLVGDDNGLQFVLNYRETLFKDIPVVFFAVNSFERAEDAARDPKITGLVEELSIEETIQVAMDLTPTADRVLAITDDTVTGQEAQEQFETIGGHYSSYDFEVLDSSLYSYEEIGQILGGLDNETILLYLAMFRDKNDQQNTIYESAVMLDNMSPIPVYLPYSNGIGLGFFGGKVVYHYEQGRMAGQMALEILEGREVNTVAFVTESPNQYLFDYEQVEAYGLKEDQFPETTVFINRDISFYEEYQTLILSVTSIIIVLLIGIVVLLFNIRERVKAERNLTIANGELTALSEELIAQEEELRSNYEDLQVSEKALKTSKERYSLVFSASSEGLWDYDYVTKKMYISGGWHRRYLDGKTMDEWRSIILEEDLTYYMAYSENIINGSTPKFSSEYRVRDGEGKVCWIHEKGVAQYNDEGMLLRVVGSHVDITQRMEKDNKIKELAYVDILTSLPNRVSLYDDFTTKYKVKDMTKDYGAMLFVDVDNFKYVNDTYGHGMGDQVLIEIGARLKEIINGSTIVYRLGGDEFVIIVKVTEHSIPIDIFTKTLQEMIAEPIHIGDSIFHLTSSIGIALMPDNGRTVSELLMNADIAMYKAKENGKDCYMYYDNHMNEEMQERMLIQNSIREALDNKEFNLFYQPIIDLNTEEVIGYEGLIRWFSRDHGFIPPDRFIGVAEQMGIIVPIGNWVFETACRFAIGVNKDPEHKVTVTVNVSPVQLSQRNFIEVFMNIVKLTGVDPHNMGIEITETALMESLEDNRRKLEALQSVGFAIYLDDFGTGYSSLNYLRGLPINVLKIDKTFIDDISQENNSTNLTEDIILIAHKVGLRVVAEGVELKDQLECLQKYKCDKVQGYLFSKPVDENEAMALRSRKEWY